MGIRILLLDDEPDLLRALSVRLRAAGYQCDTARNGKEGLAKIAQQHPDLVITDLIMPQIDGAQFIRYLRADTRTSNIPVIVLTAVPKHSNLPLDQELGVTRVIHKPFDSDELISVVQGIVGAIPSGG